MTSLVALGTLGAISFAGWYLFLSEAGCFIAFGSGWIDLISLQCPIS